MCKLTPKKAKEHNLVQSRDSACTRTTSTAEQHLLWRKKQEKGARAPERPPPKNKQANDFEKFILFYLTNILDRYNRKQIELVAFI